MATLEAAQDLYPDSQEVLNLAASVYWRSGQLSQAAETIEKIVALQPNNSLALNALGLCYLAQNDAAKAEKVLLAAVGIAPTPALIYHNLGLALQAQEKLDDAIQAYERALEIDPKLFASLSGLGHLLMAKGDSKAVSVLKRAYETSPDSAEGRLEYARAINYSNGNLDEAQSLIRSVLNSDPNNPHALTLLAMILQRLGKFEEAEALLHQSIAIDAGQAGPYWELIYGKKVGPEDQGLVAALHRMEKETARTDHERRVVSFALGKAYNDLREFGLAMKYYNEANYYAGRIEGKTFDTNRLRGDTDRMIEVFTPDRFRDYSSQANQTEEPLFIVGMFRSGTTLVEQVLSSHPDIDAGGEILFWPENASKCFPSQNDFDLPKARAMGEEYLRILSALKTHDSKRVTDKHPENYWNVGLLHLLYPKARFIFCKRHPVDNCLSFYFTFFTHSPFGSDPANLVLVYREHLRLLEHWRKVIPSDRFLEVQYEDVVAEPEKAIRRIIGFAGLPWDDRCLHPEANARMVTTASRWQVRQPIYRSSVERWRSYEPYLGVFAELL